MNALEVALDTLVQLEDRSELVLWSALFALGAFFVASDMAEGASRPGLAERLARLDVDRRLDRRDYPYESRLDRGDPRIRRVVPSPIARILRPLFEDMGSLVKQAIDRLAPGLISASDLERDLRLVRRGRTIRGFFAEKVAAALALAAIPPLLAAAGGPIIPVPAWLAAGCVGFLVPDWDLRRHLASRRARIRMELPAVLDQLAIATSAGLSLEQAIADIAHASEGIVGDEFRRLVAELEYGRWASIQEALSSLDRRNNVPELTLLATQLTTAHAQGLPVMQVLAAHADSFRNQKRTALIDAGGKSTVKMVIPIAVFILPVLAIVILVPAVVQLMQIAE